MFLIQIIILLLISCKVIIAGERENTDPKLDKTQVQNAMLVQKELQRPPAVQEAINSAFADVSSVTTTFTQFKYYGSPLYAYSGIDPVDIIRHRIKNKIGGSVTLYGKNITEIVVLDVGAGNGEWGECTAKLLTEFVKNNKIEDVVVKIISLTGEKASKPEEEEEKKYTEYFSTGTEITHQLMCAVKIENLDEDQRLQEFLGKTDIIVSSYCFLHLADPLGTAWILRNKFLPQDGMMFISDFINASGTIVKEKDKPDRLKTFDCPVLHFYDSMGVFLINFPGDNLAFGCGGSDRLSVIIQKKGGTECRVNYFKETQEYSWRDAKEKKVAVIDMGKNNLDLHEKFKDIMEQDSTGGKFWSQRLLTINKYLDPRFYSQYFVSNSKDFYVELAKTIQPESKIWFREFYPLFLPQISKEERADKELDEILKYRNEVAEKQKFKYFTEPKIFEFISEKDLEKFADFLRIYENEILTTLDLRNETIFDRVISDFPQGAIYFLEKYGHLIDWKNLENNPLLKMIESYKYNNYQDQLKVFELIREKSKESFQKILCEQKPSLLFKAIKAGKNLMVEPLLKALGGYGKDKEEIRGITKNPEWLNLVIKSLPYNLDMEKEEEKKFKLYLQVAENIIKIFAEVGAKEILENRESYNEVIEKIYKRYRYEKEKQPTIYDNIMNIMQPIEKIIK